MNASLTVADLFKLILFLLGIGVGTYLILVLSKINKILGQAGSVIENNITELDTTIKQLPEITYNVNEISKETHYAIKSLTPEVDALLRNTTSITGTVSKITDTIDDSTEKVSKTVDGVSDSILETAYNFQSNTKTINDYMDFVFEIINTLKGIFGK